MSTEAVEALVEIKQEVERKERLHAQAEGRLEKLKEDLKKEFGVSNLKEAKAKLEELQKELADKEAEFEKLVEELDEAVFGDAE